jgi:diguanylate cyclase (GGDEF)-like protein
VPSRTVAAYTLGALAVGAVFPLVGWVLGFFLFGLRLSPEFVWQLHRHDNLYWIIDCVPLLLAPTGWVLGTQKQLNERALGVEREASRRDAPTGILNHGAITEALRDAIAGAETCAVMMIDVDDLKYVNDTYGHQAGDELIVRVARLLQRDDAIVGRYGGDEFIAILPGANRERSRRYTDDVIAAVRAQDLRDPQTSARVRMSVSIGGAIFPTEAARVDDLIRIADSAMYAMRRVRPVHPDSLTARAQRRDPIATVVREIVPLLTSPGALADKLEAVSHRISAHAGYDAVDFQIADARVPDASAHATQSPAPPELVAAWQSESGRHAQHPVDAILASTHRPVFFDDPQHDALLTEEQRRILAAAGLTSAMVAPLLWGSEVIGTLGVASKRAGAFGPRDAEFVMTIATQVAALVHMTQLVDQLAGSTAELVQAHDDAMVLLAAAAEAHDRATGVHLRRVRWVSETLAREMGYPDADARELGLAAMLHDVGKIQVPESILTSTAPLSDDERAVMQRHPVWGAEFLAGRPGLDLAAVVARAHHERWDGRGYPHGLAGRRHPGAGGHRRRRRLLRRADQ